MVELMFCSVPVVLLVGYYFAAKNRIEHMKSMRISTDNQEFEKCLQEVVGASSFTLIDCRSLMENLNILKDLRYSIPANANIHCEEAVTPMQDIYPNDLA